ncbi:hypothetical protein CAL28_04510 [Bordetella genomosp. 11]|uniref:Uncharacterized protein n=1 Tax=Bordetella genomosp. 11 TaxID=1416808 RepID=A0A261UYK9_9BORD|nr:hypothetical protein CAL28_04510 [Bordetella genomosp. 11]
MATSGSRKPAAPGPEPTPTPREKPSRRQINPPTRSPSGKQSTSLRTPPLPDKKPSIPRSNPLGSDGKPSTPRSRPLVSDGRTSTSRSKQPGSDGRPSTPRSKPLALDAEPPTLRAKPSASAGNRSAPPPKASAIRAKPAASRPSPAAGGAGLFDQPLHPYHAVADALAALFCPFVEAVVHDIRTDRVTHVAHPFSPRAAGDPSDLGDVDFAPDTSVIGPYEKINWDGRRIKSVTAVLRDQGGHPIGLLCVNADVTEFEGVRRMLDGFLRTTDSAPSPDDLFRNDWHERINRYVATWTAQRDTIVARLNREQRRQLIEDLHRTGAFDGKHAPAYVAGVLGISRATVYAELARLRAPTS